MASSPITSWQIEGENVEAVTDFLFLGSKITADGDCSHKIKRCLLLGRKTMTNLHNILKSRHHFVNKGPYSQSYVFSSSHVWVRELDHKEGWVPKNWWFQTVVLEKTLVSPMDCSLPGYSIHGILSAFFLVQLSHPYRTIGKNIALTIRTFVAKWCLCFLILCLGLSELFFQGVSVF